MRAGAAIFRRLGHEARGMAAVEFAFIAPAFIILMLGTFDLGHTIYVRSLLSGAIEAAARNAALETGDTALADQMVYEAVAPAVPGLAVSTSRTSYFDFSDIGRPEPWTDTNDNGTCDNGEPYVDQNRSGAWEADVGMQGNGGASDVVIYRVEATYPALFRIPFLPHSLQERRLVATAVRKNQPFALQTGYANTSRTCTSG